jgi:hypothetical protein
MMKGNEIKAEERDATMKETIENLRINIENAMLRMSKCFNFALAACEGSNERIEAENTARWDILIRIFGEMEATIRRRAERGFENVTNIRIDMSNQMDSVCREMANINNRMVWNNREVNDNIGKTNERVQLLSEKVDELGGNINQLKNDMKEIKVELKNAKIRTIEDGSSKDENDDQGDRRAVENNERRNRIGRNPNDDEDGNDNAPRRRRKDDRPDPDNGNQNEETYDDIEKEFTNSVRKNIEI